MGIYERNIRYFCLIISILCTSISVRNQFIFNNLTLKDGLSSKETSCIYKDEEGFVWIGTRNGLDRFDGAVIRPFNHLHNKFTAFRSEYITDITEYGTGKLFLGTDKQAGVYDKISDSLRLLIFLNEKGDTLHDLYVTRFIKEGGRLWIATSTGLYICSDPDDKTALPASSFLKDTLFANKNIIGGACVWDSMRKGIWLGTVTGLVFIDPVTRVVKSSVNNPDGLPIFDNKDFISLALDEKHNMWFSSHAHPFAYFNFSDRSIHEVEWFGRDKIFTTKNTISLLYYDRQNRLWVSSSYGKVIVYDKDSSVIILPDQSPALKAGDKLWWVCKYDGLFLLNETTGQAKAFNPNAEPLKYLSFFGLFGSMKIKFMIYGSVHGYDEDVYYLKPGSDQFVSFKIHTGMPYSNDDWSYYKVENKTLYLSTANKIGLISMDVIHRHPTDHWIYRIMQNRRTKKYISKTIDYFANSVYGENSVNEICWDIARNCISQLRLEDCVVYLFDKEKGRLVQKAAYGPKNPKGHEIMNPIEIAPGEGIVGTVAATSKPLLINDTTKDSRYIVDDERRFSEISVPIMHDNKKCLRKAN